MFGLSKPRLPRLSAIGRALVSAVGVVALVGAGSGIAAGVSTSPQVAPSGSVFVGVAPTRILDTRTGVGLSGTFSNHVARTFQVTGAVIPAEALAVTGNLTVTAQTSNGYLFIGPNATNDPTSSTLNFPVGDDRANGVTVALGSGGTLSITFVAPAPGSTTPVIFDVSGYFTR